VIKDCRGATSTIKLPRFFKVVSTEDGKPWAKTQGKAGNQLLALRAVWYPIVQVLLAAAVVFVLSC